MTISKIYEPQTYGCDGTEDTYPITFDYLSTEALVDITVISAAGVETLQVLNTDYTIQDDNVIFETASIPLSTETVKLSLDPRYTQPTNYKSNTVFPKSSYETGVDSLTLTVQSIKNTLDNSIVFPVIGEDPDITVGTMAAQNADLVNITGGSIALTTPLPIASGGTNSNTATTARTALGLGTVATQNANNVSLTGGNVEGVAINITGTTRDLDPNSATDYLMTYDASAGVNKKVLLSSLVPSTYELSDDNDPELGANLDLNTRSIIFPGSTISDVKDQDNMSSDSATSSVTQQSYKAYVDNTLSLTHKIIVWGGSTQGGWVIDDSTSTAGFRGAEDNYANSGNVGLIIPCNGTISKLYIGFNISAAETDGDITFDLYSTTNGMTGITTTTAFTGGEYEASDLTNTYAASAGERIGIIPSHSADDNWGPVQFSFSFIFTPS